MLNIGKLRKGGELYYLNSVVRGIEDYYTGSGEAPGYWLARGAEELGLSGVVEREILRQILSGQSPSGAALVSQHGGGERVPGFDLTFRAPKSVSLLHALGDEEVSNGIVAAHESAVGTALDYVERHASGARRGKGGRFTIASEGFIAAAFRHRTSRAGDPLLHTHVLVANMIKGEDGRWGAVDGRLLYKHAKTAGYLYQAHLRSELTRRLGLGWERVHNGSADVAGVSRDVIRAFSKRRSEIQALVGEVKDSSAKAAQIAALETRKAKDYGVTPSELKPGWEAKAAELGLDDKTIGAMLGRAEYKVITESERHEVFSDLAHPEGLTNQSSIFTRLETIQGLCNALPSGASVTQIEDMADSFLASDRVVPLVDLEAGIDPPPEHRSRPGQRYSTPEMLATESALIEHAIARQRDGVGVVSPHIIEASLDARPSMFFDQQAMVRRLATSGDGVEVVVGKAGAGKTFALDAAREAWQRAGYQVLGCSLSARAAEELELGSGIPSSTLAALLQDLDRPETGLGSRCVVVVDEAGMVGTRQLKKLFEHAAASGAKVVLVGDDRQLPEIDAGGAFKGLKLRLTPIELSEVRRQPLGWERSALDLIREGRAQEAMDAYTEHGRVVITESAEKTRQRLLSDWWATQCGKEPAIMLAARRSDVDDLNARARYLMSAAGRLGEAQITVRDRAFAVGDRVMALKNTRRLGVKNGTRGIVEHIDLTRRELTMRRTDGCLVTLPQSYLEAGDLTHAYAMTGHKAQGMTTDRAYVLGDQTLYREWTYVAMSRGRTENRLYVVAGVDADREELGGQVARITDPMKELVSAVSRSRAKSLALDAAPPDPAGKEPAPRTASRETELDVRELSLEL